ncbi:hypothetical protein D7V80_11605 [Corallococcus sp. CA054B]|uniref:hypothetical protein n=1 Tax=Corallococcus sp. CA054B TaxID=2316734 RepID=UPI000EA08360|nr:hypothetical protein [Corallococcus sp. CA054B]RKG68637.1 hypothetical protein D7V80_11605 [Corallococcus sp. CA054B]
MEFEWQQELDALDIVPEKFRGLYAKGEGGKFTLDADVFKRMDHSGLTTALDKERKSSKALTAAQAAWLKLGKTPEDVEKSVGELKAALAKAQEGKEGAANFEKLKADLESGHAKALGERDAVVERMRGSLHKHLVEAEATAAIAEMKGSAVLLLPHVQKHVKVIEEGGGFLARVVDAEGDPRGNGKGGFLTIREFVGELKKDTNFARAFDSTGASGSGTQPKPKTGAMPSGSDKLSPTQRIAAGLASRSK